MTMMSCPWCPRPQGTRMGQGWHDLSRTDRLTVAGPQLRMAGHWAGPTKERVQKEVGRTAPLCTNHMTLGGQGATLAVNFEADFNQDGEKMGPGLELQDLSREAVRRGGLCRDHRELETGFLSYCPGAEPGPGGGRDGVPM